MLISERIWAARPSIASFLPAPLNDGGVLGVDADLLGLAEVGELHGLELLAEVLEERRAAGQDRQVFEHRLAAIAVARGLDRTDLDDAAELVDDEGRAGLPLRRLRR